MTVYIDDAYLPYGRMLMCHMMADTLDELHAMAHLIGLKRAWFQNKPRYPHYDVSKGYRRLAVSQGAIECTSKELVRRFMPISLLLTRMGYHTVPGPDPDNGKKWVVHTATGRTAFYGDAFDVGKWAVALQNQPPRLHHLCPPPIMC